MKTVSHIWDERFAERLIEDGLLTRTPYPKPNDIAIRYKEGKIAWIGTLTRDGLVQNLKLKNEKPIALEGEEEWSFFYHISDAQALRYRERPEYRNQ